MRRLSTCQTPAARRELRSATDVRHPRRERRRRAVAAVGLALFAGLFPTGCVAPQSLDADAARVQVVTTTGILADLARHVGGDRVNVSSLVPDRADPHVYEPSLRDVRNVVYADVAFSNYMLLEQQA